MSGWILGGIWQLLILAALPSNEPPIEVARAEARPDLTRRFERTDGWTGADGAYTIPLGKDRTLWLFADTWIGKIENGRRVNSGMVNNTAAWQDLGGAPGALRFFWRQPADGPAALLRPEEREHWYWPGDGAVVDGRLYLFCKVVRRKAEGAPGFQFDWFENELLCIDNPRDEPTAWKVRRCALPGGADALRLGVACLLEGEYLYVYGLFPTAACKPLEAPLALARIGHKKLAALDMTGLEYWSRGAKGDGWSDRPTNPVPLFRDGAPEMSVSRLRGIDGFVATYTPIGLGRDISVRHAPKPEGPWSSSLRVYRCPKAGEDVFFYGAKAHPELAERDGQLFITYCRNTGVLAEDVRRPDVYVPQVVEVQLRLKGTAGRSSPGQHPSR